VATDGTGTEELWDAIVAHRAFLETGPSRNVGADAPRAELDKVLAAMVRARIDLAHGAAYEARSTAARRRDRSLPRGRDAAGATHDRDLVAYDVVFLVHVMAAVATLIVLVAMRWSAQAGRARRRRGDPAGPLPGRGATGRRA
jgi:hypothetical protein